MQKFELPFILERDKAQLVDQRISEFKNLHQSDNEEWFSELCFCLLTANAQAKRALKIQNFLGVRGFLNKSEVELAEIIKSFGHRFHNNKAKYILNARKFKNIKDLIGNKNDQEAREFLVKNVKGLGYKEASHFLRNVGYSSVAIIDRHILRFMHNFGMIREIPKTITKNKYLEFEKKLKKFNINLDKLDLMIWCHMTGEVLK